MAGTCECGNEPSGSIKGEEFNGDPRTVSFSRWTVLNGSSYFVVIFLLKVTVHYHPWFMNFFESL